MIPNIEIIFILGRGLFPPAPRGPQMSRDPQSFFDLNVKFHDCPQLSFVWSTLFFFLVNLFYNHLPWFAQKRKKCSAPLEILLFFFWCRLRVRSALVAHFTWAAPRDIIFTAQKKTSGPTQNPSMLGTYKEIYLHHPPNPPPNISSLNHLVKNNPGECKA